MERNTIEKILNFLEEKEGKQLPKKWFDSIEKLKLVKELENHPDGTQYRYNGNLYLSHSNITKLPNDLYVDGSLYLVETNITKLPDKLYVDRSLSLKGCGELTQLPDNLHVGYILSLSETNISELPNKLYVRRDLYINDTPLSDKYTDEEITEMITSKGGTLIGKIYR